MKVINQHFIDHNSNPYNFNSKETFFLIQLFLKEEIERSSKGVSLPRPKCFPLLILMHFLNVLSILMKFLKKIYWKLSNFWVLNFCDVQLERKLLLFCAWRCICIKKKIWESLPALLRVYKNVYMCEEQVHARMW